jgi:hypothetical protein
MSLRDRLLAKSCMVAFPRGCNYATPSPDGCTVASLGKCNCATFGENRQPAMQPQCNCRNATEQQSTKQAPVCATTDATGLQLRPAGDATFHATRGVFALQPSNRPDPEERPELHEKLHEVAPPADRDPFDDRVVCLACRHRAPNLDTCRAWRAAGLSSALIGGIKGLPQRCPAHKPTSTEA